MPILTAVIMSAIFNKLQISTSATEVMFIIKELKDLNC
jgi:hypothetical protein